MDRLAGMQSKTLSVFAFVSGSEGRGGGGQSKFAGLTQSHQLTVQV